MMTYTINSERFVGDLISEYVERGFGTLAKRDLEVFLFHLLHKHGYFGDKLDFFQMSKMLRISETKVRNLYQDVQLRYNMYTEDQAKERFVQLLESGRFDVDPGRGYRLQIRDPLLRQFVEEWVDSVNGISDSSFSPTIIVIPREVFLDMKVQYHWQGWVCEHCLVYYFKNSSANSIIPFLIHCYFIDWMIYFNIVISLKCIGLI
jgi:hypothetical protein